jgi:DNA mismatch repair ATPase MutS
MSAEKFNHIRPEMTAENILIIKDGRLVYCNCYYINQKLTWHYGNFRHPLEELLTGTFIKNDTCLGCSESTIHTVQSSYWSAEKQVVHDEGRKENYVMLLSAPNQSGKSIYLKQVSYL